MKGHHFNAYKTHACVSIINVDKRKVVLVVNGKVFKVQVSRDLKFKNRRLT